MNDKRILSIRDYQQRKTPQDILVDMRTPYVYSLGTIPGAKNIPLDQLDQLYSLPKECPIYIFCQSGELSESVFQLLLDAGYDAYHLAGGYREYLMETFQAE